MTTFRCEDSILHSEDVDPGQIVALCREGFDTFEDLFSDFDRAYQVVPKSELLANVSWKRISKNTSALKFCGKASEALFEDCYEFIPFIENGVVSMKDLCSFGINQLNEKFEISYMKIDRCKFEMSRIGLSFKPQSEIVSESLQIVRNHMDDKLPQKATAHQLGITISKVSELRRRVRSLSYEIKGYPRRIKEWEKEMERFR